MFIIFTLLRKHDRGNKWFCASLEDTTGCFRASRFICECIIAVRSTWFRCVYRSNPLTRRKVSKAGTRVETSSASSTQGEDRDRNRKQRKGATRRVRGFWEDRRKDYKRKKARIASWQTEKYMEITVAPGKYTLPEKRELVARSWRGDITNVYLN